LARVLSIAIPFRFMLNGYYSVVCFVIVGTLVNIFLSVRIFKILKIKNKDIVISIVMPLIVFGVQLLCFTVFMHIMKTR